MSFVPTQVHQPAATTTPPPAAPPPEEAAFIPTQVQPAAAAPEPAEPAPAAEAAFVPQQVQPAPPPLGPVAGALNAVSNAVSNAVPDAIEDPLSGWVPDVAAVTTALGQGDLGGAIAPVFEYANRPFEFGSARQGERAASGQGQVPTPGEIVDDPSAIFDVVPGFWNTGGPGAWAVGADIDAWAEQNPQAAAEALAQGGGQAVYETWKASGGLSTTPAGVDSPFDDERYGGSVLDRAGQAAGELGQFGGSVLGASRQGTLTPFLKGLVADIGNDPSLAAQIGLAALTGGLSAAGGVAGRKGLVGLAEGLTRASAGGRAINRAADVALDPVTTSLEATLAPAARGVRNLGGLLDYSRTSRQARTMNALGEATSEYLATRPNFSAAASPPAVTPGLLHPPAANGAAALPSPTPQPRPGGAPLLPATTMYNPPATPLPARTLPAGRGDPYTRGTPPAGAAPNPFRQPTIQPAAASAAPADSLAVRHGAWRTAAGQAVADGHDIAMSLRATTRRIYDEMMTADAVQFWDRFDAVSHTADVDHGSDGFYARWRAAMRQGLYLLDDWPEARVRRQLPGAQTPGGGINWPEVGRLAQQGDATARRAMGGKRAHDLYVHRIAGSPDPDREVYNLLVTFHLDQHAGRFNGKQYGPLYWQQRAEHLAEILRDAGYTPSAALLQRLEAQSVGDLIASELVGRVGNAVSNAQTLAKNGVLLLHLPGRSRPVSLGLAPAAAPSLPARAAQISTATPPPPAPVNLAPTPQQRQVTTSFGYLSATKRQGIVDRLPDDAVMGPDAVPVSIITNARLAERLPDGFRFNDGSHSDATVREVIDETARELEQWVDMAGDPALQTGPAGQEFARLSQKFTIDGEVLNAAALRGPENAFRRDVVVEEIIRAAAEQAFPRARKADFPGASGYQAFLDMRRRVQLYNFLNLPRFVMQQHLGNSISTAIAGRTGTALSILTNLRDYRAVNRQLNNPAKYTLFIDDLQRQIGGGNLREITQSNRAALALDAGGNLETAMGPFAHMARLLAPGKAVNIGKISDTITRSTTGEDELLAGFRRMNQDLARETHRWSREYGLPYTAEQINDSIQRFLQQRRVVIDGNTGKPHTTLFGRTATFEPTYSARDLRDWLRSDLPQLARPTSLTRSDPLELLIRRIGADVSNNIKVIQQATRNEINRVAFEWMPNNLDEVVQQFTLYHFWMTRAGGLYAKQMLKNPWALAAFGRMMDDFQDQLDELDGPDWLKGWFQFMNTPAGFTVWYSPVDLFSTLLTFADWQMEAGESPFDDLTWLGRQRNHVPFLLNPALDFVAYAVGAYGPDAQIPDLLGLNRPATMATDLLNLANAHNLLPAWVRAAGIGVDAAGNPVPLQPKKLSELYARVGNGLSTALKTFTGLRPTPIPDTAASQSRSIAYILEQNFRTDYPGLPQEEIDRKVTDALADPGSPEYQRAWRMQADMPYMMGDTPLPGWAEGALRTVLSPIQMYAGTEQQFLDSTMKGIEPSGAVPPRNLPTYTLPDGTLLTAADLSALSPEEAQAMAAADPGFGQWLNEVSWANNAAKFGASKTVEGRVLAEQVSAYYDAGDAAINAVKSTANGIYFGNAAEPVSVGGVTYAPEEIAAFDQETRKALANQYRDEQGVTWEMIEANDAARDAYLDANPNVAAYLAWKNAAYDHPGGEVGYIQELLATNPAYADYIGRNTYDLTTGKVDYEHALSSDAFLAAQGIAPTLYEPVSAPSMEPLPAPRNQTVRPTVALDIYPGPDASLAPLAQADAGFPMTLVELADGWAKVTIGGQEGYVDAGFLENAPGGIRPQGLSGAIGGLVHGGLLPAAQGAGQGIASLIDEAGAVVGTMFGGGGTATKPARSAFAPGEYGLEPAPDGYGVKSTADSDRMWMEDMIGGGHAIVTTDYKGAPPAGVWYGYQDGHGADGTTHAAYDISCDTGYVNGVSTCPGTPIFAPLAGNVVCAGYGQGTGQAMGSPACTYSQHTTRANPDGSPPAHTVVLDVGVDAAGNALQLSFNHMGTSELVPGQGVEAGDLLGGMGDTDGGPHLHLEGWAYCPSAGTYLIVDPALIVSGYYQSHPAC